MQKNLQRDFRDIRSEFDKLNSGQSSELATTEQQQRAHLRLREISALLSSSITGTRLIDSTEINDLLGRMQSRIGASSMAR
jgi:hypothetical protein